MKARTIIERAGGLVSASDLAKQWGISKQRVGILTGREGFPEPVATVNGQPVWLTSEANEWRENRQKRS